MKNPVPVEYFTYKCTLYFHYIPILCIETSTSFLKVQISFHVNLIFVTLLYAAIKCDVCAELLQLCLNLCDSVDHSQPGSFVHGIFQARILERVAMPSSRESSSPRDRICVSYVSCIGRQLLYQ